MSLIFLPFGYPSTVKLPERNVDRLLVQLIVFLRQRFVGARLHFRGLSGPGRAALGRGSGSSPVVPAAAPPSARGPARLWRGRRGAALHRGSQRLRQTGRSCFSAFRPKPAPTAAAPGHGRRARSAHPTCGVGSGRGGSGPGPCSPRGVTAEPLTHGQAHTHNRLAVFAMRSMLSDLAICKRFR